MIKKLKESISGRALSVWENNPGITKLDLYCLLLHFMFEVCLEARPSIVPHYVDFSTS